MGRRSYPGGRVRQGGTGFAVLSVSLDSVRALKHGDVSVDALSDAGIEVPCFDVMFGEQNGSAKRFESRDCEPVFLLEIRRDDEAAVGGETFEAVCEDGVPHFRTVPVVLVPQEHEIEVVRNSRAVSQPRGVRVYVAKSAAGSWAVCVRASPGEFGAAQIDADEFDGWRFGVPFAGCGLEELGS